MFDFANGLEDSLFDVPDHSDADSDQDTSEDRNTRDVFDDRESSEIDPESDNPNESNLTDDDEGIEAEELDGSNEWTGFDARDSELRQHNLATEDTVTRDSDTRPSGVHPITAKCFGNNGSTERYIPPGLREESGESQGEDITKLTRQLKGLINR